MNLLRKLINSQIWLNKKFDKILPSKFRVDGNQDFKKTVVPAYLKPNLKIYDIGGGKRPFLSVNEKKILNATVCGVDIDEDELKKAPEGSYDSIICEDISKYRGFEDGDIIICQALLEHVKDVASAFQAFSTILKSGGTALIFVPSRNALFAKLNNILPNKIKKKILYSIFPNKKDVGGFKSYYNKCTPKEFKKLSEKIGFKIVDEKYYFISSYFSFFFPFYFLWRMWLLMYYIFFRNNAAETFTYVLKK